LSDAWKRRSDNILSVVPRTDHAARMPEHASAMPIKEQAERFAITVKASPPLSPVAFDHGRHAAAV
jgi:hypothetical protein